MVDNFATDGLEKSSFSGILIGPKSLFCFTLIARNFENYYVMPPAAAYLVPGTQQTQRAQQYTHESYDTVRSPKAQCEAAPDNPETGHTYITVSRGRNCAGNFGEEAASAKIEHQTGELLYVQAATPPPPLPPPWSTRQQAT